MASIQKRQTVSGAPAYIVKWKTPDGRHRTKGGFRTRKAAQVYATQVAAAALNGQAFDPKAGQVTFRAAAAGWLKGRHDLKPTTLAEHTRALGPAAATRRSDGTTLSIDAVFGAYPINAITREQITAWISKLTAAGKSPSTVRYKYHLVRMVLAQAVVDGLLTTNPADYVKLPTEHNTTVDDPTMFLTAAQVTALVTETPWPYSIYVHLAAWAGLRAAELCGLQVGDVESGSLRVERTVQPLGGELIYLPPKTKGSRRRVPLTDATYSLLAEYLAAHPRGKEPSAPLFPGLVTARPAVLDWAKPLRHGTFYHIYHDAVKRAGLPPARLTASW